MINEEDLLKLKSSVSAYLRDENYELSQIVKNAEISIEHIGYQGYCDVFQIVFSIPINTYKQIKSAIEIYQKELLEVVMAFVSNDDDTVLYSVILRPELKQYLDWSSVDADMTAKKLLGKIDEIKQIMIAVGTGKRIQDFEQPYKEKYKEIDEILYQLGVPNPNNCSGLWDWYHLWINDGLGTYASRRTYIKDLYNDLITMISQSLENDDLTYELTGWQRVDRSLYEMKSKLTNAINEEQFQAIALIGRETLISIAQEVFDNSIHKCDDGTIPSDTDSKRMLDAYISYSLQGSSNERHRKFAKSAIDLANQVTHDRCATKRDAEMCFIAVSAVSNLIQTINN